MQAVGKWKKKEGVYLGYQDAEILRDKLGNPIPQEYDPVKGQFVPKTNQFSKEILNILQADKLILGAYWNKTSSPTLIRTDAAEGLQANVGLNGELVQNDFDKMPVYSEISEVMDEYGNTFIRFPKFYIRKREGQNFKTWQISKTRYTGFYLPWCFWDFENGKELDYVDVGKYKASLSVDNKLESKLGNHPLVSRNIVQFRTYAQNNNDGALNIKGYQQLDIHVYDMLQTLFYIEFATLDSQAVMRGYTAGAYSDSHTAILTESATNRIVVTSSVADQFVVGQSVGVGTSRGSTSIFIGRVILAIEPYPTNNRAIIFDGDPVDITEGNVVWSCGWKNGFSIDIAAHSGSIGSNTNGKYPCVYRGVESPWGDLWQFVDGININDHQAWVAKNAEDYASNVFAKPYEQLGYVNSDSNGYPTKMGHDPSLPFAEFPTDLGGGSSTYYADYYYQNTGQRIALVGGYWAYGSDAGLSSWYLSYSSGSSYVALGGRLLKKPL